MTARLPVDILIGALLRRVNDAGGMAMVLAKGDRNDGAMLFVTYNRSLFSGIFQREPDMDGGDRLVRIGPDDAGEPGAITDYWQRRRRSDPDLWVIELDIAEAERFAAETVLTS